ncbi:unnamed protein product [Ceutorhynchus assimilis]|uniref:Cytochrome P450 n=1 Tax=Ceutorhynchus assimilis TaxID=467358 RepID=A0A9N9MKU3_9CUCU|nr:unnamed protein product [Ceutorhynchus assimilis]
MHLVTILLFASIIFLIILEAFVLLWKQRKRYFAAQKFDGPKALPIIGNGLLFMCHNDEILMRMYNVIKDYPEVPMRFWLGPLLLIILPNPIHVEKIMPSNKFARKFDLLYRFPKVFLNEGLITGSGPIYKKHRRIIQPMFDLKFAKECTSFMHKHVDLCMQRLEPHVGKGNFDFFHAIHPCMADIIKETVLGSNERTQIIGTSDFDQAMLDAYDFTFTRMVKYWQQIDFLFNMSPLKKRQDELKRIVTTKAKEMTDAAFERRKSSSLTQEFYPIIDRMADYTLEHPGVLDETFIDHVLTLYTASEDTLTIASSFLAMCIGMYPECQEKAAQEIRTIFGETPREVTTEDIPKLCYIDMCIKEVLRLFPIAPIILRQCTEDFELDHWTIPKGCALVIPIFNLQRDPRYWEKPHEFYPEHFLPEAVAKRHVYTYIPFSAGPRGCIGKILANTGLKVFVCNLLQHYEIECDGDVPSLRIRMDISTRPIDGSYLRLKKRVWK